MKDCIGFIIKANEKDMENKNLNELHMIETELFSMLSILYDGNDNINEVVTLMLAGREKAFNNELDFEKLFKHYRYEPIVIYPSNDMKIDYIISKRDKLNEYLEIALDNIKE